MKKRLLPFVLLFTVLIISSCHKEPEPEPKDNGYSTGIFILNEGAFGNSNASVTYFDPDSLKVVNHLFEQINERPLGDVAVSFTRSQNKGYIVVNNSQKIEVVNLKTFESTGSINGLSYPRQLMLIDDQRGYLTDGNFEGNVLVIDLPGLQITDTIPVGSGPEGMIRFRDRVIVANSGGFGNDSTLSVIDPVTDEVTDTWTVGYNPVQMVIDADNYLWVLCKGKTIWNSDWTLAVETQSELVQLDPENGEVMNRIPVGTIGDFFWPEHLAITTSGDQLFFIENGGIYRILLAQPETPHTPFISGTFYGFGIEPYQKTIYSLSVPSFTRAGYLVRYKPDGTLIDSLMVGIGPNQVVF